MNPLRALPLLLCAAAIPASPEPASVPQGVLPAVQAFLDNLSAEERAAIILPFNSEERLNWHYFPRVRPGIAYGAMNEEQQDLAMRVLRAALSDAGFEKVEAIRSLEAVLREIEGSDHRDTDRYYFTLFGEPSASTPWGLRYEGHHLSLNWTFADGKIFGDTPQFLGAHPAEVRQGPLAGTRPLAEEEDLARALVRSLTAQEQEVAILDPVAPPEILTGAERDVTMLEDRGLAYDAMREEHQGMLLRLLEVYANCHSNSIAHARLQAIRDAGLEHVKFAWMGGLEPGQGHYYRIQGPTFVVEYDNTQNNANHIHTVWRDFEGDFGRDLLREHYERSH